MSHRTGNRNIWVSLFLVLFPFNEHTHTNTNTNAQAWCGHRPNEANISTNSEPLQRRSIHLRSRRNDPERARFRLSTQKHRSAYDRFFVLFSFSLLPLSFVPYVLSVRLRFFDRILHAKFKPLVVMLIIKFLL